MQSIQQSVGSTPPGEEAALAHIVVAAAPELQVLDRLGDESLREVLVVLQQGGQGGTGVGTTAALK